MLPVCGVVHMCSCVCVLLGQGGGGGGICVCRKEGSMYVWYISVKCVYVGVGGLSRLIGASP